MRMLGDDLHEQGYGRLKGEKGTRGGDFTERLCGETILWPGYVTDCDQAHVVVDVCLQYQIEQQMKQMMSEKGVQSSDIIPVLTDKTAA